MFATLPGPSPKAPFNRALMILDSGTWDQKITQGLLRGAGRSKTWQAPRVYVTK